MSPHFVVLVMIASKPFLSDEFDLVLGFSGDTVLPEVVTQDLIGLIDRIAVH